MELLEIKSAYDLSAHQPASRRAAVHSYLISCRQFTSVLANWRKPGTPRTQNDGQDSTYSFMTLSAEQIWVTEAEIEKIETAIRASRSSVTLT